jgi:hypothetical protein
VGHNKASENCCIAAIASGDAVLTEWFCVVATWAMTPIQLLSLPFSIGFKRIAGRGSHRFGFSLMRCSASPSGSSPARALGQFPTE